MPKCFVCKSRKAKRKCLISTDGICSLCCGGVRTKVKCEGCNYYRETHPKETGRSELVVNKARSINEMVGTGIPTLLAINLKLMEGDFSSDRSLWRESDDRAIPKIRDTLGKGDIRVIPKADGTVHVRTKNGVIVMTP